MRRKRNFSKKVDVVDHDTGELLDTIMLNEYIAQERKTTEKQRTSYRDRIAAELFYQDVKQESKDHGGFTMLEITDSIKSLNPATIGRLIFLSTYLEYGTQRLIYSKRPMLKNDLEVVLKLGKTAKNQFFNECEKAGILEDRGKDGLFLSGIFFRHEAKNSAWFKLYHDTIRDLYSRMLPSYHNHLGFIVYCLKRINLEWNTLCFNPTEKNIDKVQVMTLKEFCKEIRYDYHNVARLKEALTGLWFEWNGEKQALCKLIPINTENGNELAIAINPHLIFHGTDFGKVEVLGMYFTPRKAKKQMQRGLESD